jgi:hypothetical protein
MSQAPDLVAHRETADAVFAGAELEMQRGNPPPQVMPELELRQRRGTPLEAD